jgi:hypothetical protein
MITSGGDWRCRAATAWQVGSPSWAPVRCDRGDAPLDVSEQERHLCCVIGTPVGQHVSADLTGAGVNGGMQLSPVSSGPTVLGCIPFAWAEQLQPVLSATRWIGPGLGSTRGHRPATPVHVG